MSNFLDSEQWLEVLDTISEFVTDSTERRSVIRTFLPDMLDTGYSGTQALDLFRQSKMGISTQEFFRIRSTIREDVNEVSYLRNLNLDEILESSRLRVSSQELTAKYRIVAAYAMEDVETNTVRFGEWAYDTNQLGEKGDIINRIIEDIQQRYPNGNFETLTVNLRRGYVDLSK